MFASWDLGEEYGILDADGTRPHLERWLQEHEPAMVLSVATDVRRSVAVGLLVVMAYVLVEFLVVFNPAVWWRERQS